MRPGERAAPELERRAGYDAKRFDPPDTRDALRLDTDGVGVFNPKGEPIGHIALPERCALHVNAQRVAGG